MTCANLLQYHAQSLLDSNLYPPAKRKRIGVKQCLGENALLQQLVMHPQTVIFHQEINWAKKRRLHGFVAHITVHHYGMRVVAARTAIKDLWRDATKEMLQNWKLLESRFEWPTLSSEAKDDAEPYVQDIFSEVSSHGTRCSVATRASFPALLPRAAKWM